MKTLLIIIVSLLIACGGGGGGGSDSSDPDPTTPRCIHDGIPVITAFEAFGVNEVINLDGTVTYVEDNPFQSALCSQTVDDLGACFDWTYEQCGAIGTTFNIRLIDKDGLVVTEVGNVKHRGEGFNSTCNYYRYPTIYLQGLPEGVYEFEIEATYNVEVDPPVRFEVRVTESTEFSFCYDDPRI